MIALACAAVLTIAAGFHFYWGLGGRVGYDAAIPRRPGGERLLNPTPSGAYLVGIALIAAAAMLLATAQVRPAPVPSPVLHGAVTLMGTGFVVRGTWFSQYAGLLKSVRTSRFARYDTLLCSPLCLVLGVSMLLVGARS